MINVSSSKESTSGKTMLQQKIKKKTEIIHQKLNCRCKNIRLNNQSISIMRSWCDKERPKIPQEYSYLNMLKFANKLSTQWLYYLGVMSNAPGRGILLNM